MRERREEIQTQKLKNTCLLCPNLEKPSQLQELTQARWVFTPKKTGPILIVIVSRPEPDVELFS